ncbi:MAG: ABC transporter permease [Chloroflexi bacterium]|nr:ABC transporter permease [Chloroflexota bacterium]
MRAVHLALFELRSYLRDMGDLAFSLLLPITLLAVMLGAFGQQDQFNGTAYVVDEDNGPYAQQVIGRLKEIKGLDVRLISASDAESRLDRANITVAAYIPQGFSQRLSGGQGAQVTFKQRGNGGQEGQIVASIVRGVVQEVAGEAYVRNQVQAALSGSGTNPSDVASTVDGYLERERRSPTVGVREEDVGKRPNMLFLFLPGVITMFALFAVSLRSQAILDERRNGTLERLLVTRLGAGELFFGKFLAGLARGLAQVVILLVLAEIVFRIFTPVSFFSTLLVAALFVATVSAIGLVIASVARTREQASWIATIFTLVMSMLGGTFFEVQSGLLRTLSRITINWYANDALKALITGDGTLAKLGLQMAVIGGVGLVAFFVARALFKAVPEGK